MWSLGLNLAAALPGGLLLLFELATAFSAVHVGIAPPGKTPVARLPGEVADYGPANKPAANTALLTILLSTFLNRPTYLGARLRTPPQVTKAHHAPALSR
jgi:hypothetical protein